MVFKKYLFLFIWLCQILVSARSIFDLCRGMPVLLVVAFEFLVAAVGLKFPDQGLNLGPLNWERGVAVTGPQGRSPYWFSDFRCFGI